MADPRSNRSGDSGRRDIGVWPLVIGAALVILAALWFFMGRGVQEPVPTPDSPAATGTAGQPSGTTGGTADDAGASAPAGTTGAATGDAAGQPSGTTGAGAEPGAPAGAEAPEGAPVVEPNPDLAPGTGVDTTRGSN